MIFKRSYKVNCTILEFEDPGMEAKFLDNRLKFIMLCSLTKRALIMIGGFCFLVLLFEIFADAMKSKLDECLFKKFKYVLVLVFGALLEYCVSTSQKYCKYRTIPSYIITICLISYLSFEKYFSKYNEALFDLRYDLLYK